MQYRQPEIVSQTQLASTPVMSSSSQSRLVSADGPNFAVPIADDGYAWWYIDASSDCGQFGLTLIIMLGCVFSPWYRRARKQGAADPLNHAAYNLALYAPDKRWWTMTERDRSAVAREAHRLAIGPSEARWESGTLHIEIKEITAPWRRPVSGQIRLTPPPLRTQAWQIDAQGTHRWTPIAPRAKIEVVFEQPRLNWQGHAYFDGNEGDAPLEQDFRSWEWTRGHDGEDSVIFYDVQWRHGGSRALALRIPTEGAMQALDTPPLQRLRSTPWGIARHAHCDQHQTANVLRTLEDGPFYARSLMKTCINSEPLQVWHESVSLKRFQSRWVQALLPVRLPRVTSR
jgi:carotenoid 1,2-hydratase